MPPPGLSTMPTMILLTSLKTQMIVITQPACCREKAFFRLRRHIPVIKTAHSPIQIQCSAVNIVFSFANKRSVYSIPYFSRGFNTRQPAGWAGTGLHLRDLPQFLADGTEALGDLLFRHVLGNADGAGCCRSFIVPALVLHHIHGVPQFLHLGLQCLPLAAEHLQPQLDGIVPLQRHFNILPDVLDGQAGFFHAADHLQPLKVRILKHPDAAGGPLDKGQQSLLVVITQRGRCDSQQTCHFSHGVDH